MQTFIRLAALLGLLSLAACAQLQLSKPSSDKPSSDKILHLTFDGNLLDSSGHHRDARARGKATYGLDRFANPNGAIVLDGNTTLSVADDNALRLAIDSFTISFWIRTGDTNDVSILSKGPANGKLPGYDIGLRHGRAYAALTGGGRNIEISGSNYVSNNIWHLVTLAVSPSKVLLYVDTSVAGSSEGVRPRVDSLNNGALAIGGSGGSTRSCKGSVDNIMIEPGMINRQSLIIRYGPGGIAVANLTDLPLRVPRPEIIASGWVNDAIGYCCGVAGLIEKTTDGGAKWIPLNCTNQTLCAIDLFGTQTAIVAGAQGSVGVTTDAGVSWNAFAPDYTAWQWQNVVFNDVVFLDATHALLAGARTWASSGEGILVLATINGGQVTFSQVPIPPPIPSSPPITSPPPVNALTFSNGTVWATGEGPTLISLQYPVNGPLGAATYITPAINDGSTFRSCHLLRTGSSVIGLVGSDGGKIYMYSSPPVAGPEWTSHQLPDQVQAVRILANGSMWAGILDGQNSSGILKWDGNNWILQSTIAGLQLQNTDWLSVAGRGNGLAFVPVPCNRIHHIAQGTIPPYDEIPILRVP